ncbi:GGDEF domain-containing protein [Phycisphaerales bacterium ac7]
MSFPADPTPNPPVSASADFSGPIRVILAGRVTLERTLRRDPEVELIRVQTPLRALGELAQPMDDASPRATVIVLAGGALPEGHEEAFVEAARSLDPAVRFVVSLDDPLGQAPPPFDLVVTASTTVEQFRASLADRPAARPEPESVVSSETDAAPIPDPDPDPNPALPRQTEIPDDAKLVRAILTGRDVASAAMEQLRRRTGNASLELRPEPTARSCARLAHRGHALGYLCDAAQRTDPSELKVHALWLSHWIALAEQQRQLREAAFTDSLTGAWNRRYFDRYLENCLAEAARNRQPVTILLFDVDDFKNFNDQHGHAVGDEILRATVRLLKTCVRPEDRVCRIGGDEFAVVFYQPDGPREAGSSQPTSIFEIARRFQKRVQTEEFRVLGTCSPGPLAISGGLATFPWDGRTPSELLGAADRLLIESKSAGKNAIRYGSGVLCCDDSSRC